MSMHDPAEPRPVTAAYYYSVRWGHHDEWLDLFRRNHWPVLREQLAAAGSRTCDCTCRATTATVARTGTCMVTITYRDWAALEAHSEQAIKDRLYPDQETLPGGGAAPVRAARGALGRAADGAAAAGGVTDLRREPGSRCSGSTGPVARMWRINREAVLLGAGPAALLLQVAHPLVAEGVAAAQPASRTTRSGGCGGPCVTTLDMVFGDGPTAERARRARSTVSTAPCAGPVDGPGGTRGDRCGRYRAIDPELLLWVQATLIVTSVEAYRALGRAADARPIAEAFWSEARAVGVRMGIPLRGQSRRTGRALLAYWERMLAPDGPIQVTDDRPSRWPR